MIKIANNLKELMYKLAAADDGFSSTIPDPSFWYRQLQQTSPPRPEVGTDNGMYYGTQNKGPGPDRFSRGGGPVTQAEAIQAQELAQYNVPGGVTINAAPAVQPPLNSADAFMPAQDNSTIPDPRFWYRQPQPAAPGFIARTLQGLAGKMTPNALKIPTSSPGMEMIPPPPPEVGTETRLTRN